MALRGPRGDHGTLHASCANTNAKVERAMHEARACIDRAGARLVAWNTFRMFLEQSAQAGCEC
eukprot:15468748-Alexandrium_andersonii.AAC.1